MPTTILLIENDAGFARDLTDALEGAGFQVRVTGDGKEGLDLAREVSPAAIVLCVELPKMSGYSICQKLKKDDALRGIPLILTSAEATAETFEQHKKLKARAEDYLLKPYAPADLVAALVPFTGQPEAPPATTPAPGEEEVVSLEEELGLEMLPGEGDGDLPALDLASLPDEPAPAGAGEPLAAGGEDEDLRLLDDAFAGLSGPAPAPTPAPLPAEAPAAQDAGAELDLALDGETPVAADEVDAAAASLPPEEAAPDRSGLESVADEADLALGALGADEPTSASDAIDALDALDGLPGAAEAAPTRAFDEEPAAPPPAPSHQAAAPEPAPAAMDFAPELAAALDLAPDAPAAQVRGASADVLRAAGISLLDDGPAAPPPALKVVPPPEPEPLPGARAAGGDELGHLEAELADRRAALAARDAELRDLHDRLDALTHRAVDAESALAAKEAEAAAALARAEALTSQVKRGEADLKAGREEARKASDALRAAEDRARAAEGQAGAADAKARAAEERARAADDRATAAEARASAAESKAAAAEGKASTALEKARAAEAQASAAEAKSVAAAAEATRHRSAAADAARSLEAKVAELAVAAAAAAKLEGVERELDELKTELIVARGEVEGARSEVEKRSAELKKRIADLEATNAKNEERVVKAYLKIKGDEKVRDKARKALAIALQLLEEGLPPEAPGAARPPAAGASKLE